MNLMLFLSRTILLTALLSFSVAAQTPAGAAGRWTGGIDLPGVRLGISVDLAQKSAADWTGTIAIPAQGIKDSALGNVVVRDGHVSFVMPGVKGDPAFSGRLAAGGQVIAGDFTQSGRTFPFRLVREGSEAAESFGPTPESGAPGSGFAGDWQGTLDAGVMTLRLIFRIRKAADGTYTALLDSPDQGVTEMKIDTLRVQERSLHLELQRISAVYDGTLNQDGSEISGEFQQSGNNFQLTLKRLAGKAAKPEVNK